MKHIKNNNIQQTNPTVVTLGNFDGIHLGHESLINKTRILAEENGYKSIVFTFEPHPKLVFSKNKDFGLVMSPEEKKIAIEGLGVDAYIEYPFDEYFAKTSPEDFVNNILVDKLKCKILIVGDDYHFGAGARGDVSKLKELGAVKGMQVIAMPSIMLGDEKVSSTRIRKYLIDTDFDGVESMLNRRYSIWGVVVKGRQIGRTIGFPTLNMLAYNNKVFPPNGVYATKTLIKGETFYGITNIGTNPTVNGNEKMVETHLFDFDQVVYGEEARVSFYKFIRNEKKFPSLDDLKLEIKNNTKEVKEFFGV